MIQNLVFGVGIHAGKGVIKNQDARIADDRTGNRSSLLLTSGERDTALAYQCFVLLGEILNFRRDVGGFCCGVDVLIAGILFTEGNIFADGFAEQESFLRDETNVV